MTKNNSPRTNIPGILNIIKLDGARPSFQRDLFPAEYWKHLNFVQRALLVEQINKSTSKTFVGYCEKWADLPRYFQCAVIDYVEDEHKPVVFYHHPRGAL